MRAFFLCAYTRAIAHYAAKAVAINRQYCERWGYGLRCDTDEEVILRECEGRSTFWYYFKMLAQEFGRADVEWFVKLDCDAVCVNHQTSLEHWLDRPEDLLFATDHGPDVINAGVQLIRNSEINRMHYQQVWEAAEVVARGQFKTGCWHEQTLLSAAIALRRDVAPKVQVVPNSVPLSFNCFEPSQLRECLIFHDIAKTHIPRLVERTAVVGYELAAEPVREALPVGDQVLIVAATYGTCVDKSADGQPWPILNEHSRDVLDMVQSLVRKQATGERYEIPVNNTIFGGDPHNGVPKQLRVWTAINGDVSKTHCTVTPEGSNLALEI